MGGGIPIFMILGDTSMSLFDSHLGDITVSRRILAKLSVEEIQRVLAQHQASELIFSDDNYLKRLMACEIHRVSSQHETAFGNVTAMTSVLDGKATDLFFTEEMSQTGRGYFSWENYLKRQSPFTLGRIIVTEAVNRIIGMPTIHQLIEKQLSYDWGSIRKDDWHQNDAAVENNDRVVSRHIVDGENLFVITEADRSATTILFSYEY